MGKITKVLQTKHKESMSPWLADYVLKATKTPLPLLPRELDAFPSRWPFPRGDLYHWIPLLNRFDNILECFVGTYELKDAAQKRDFAREILLETTSHPIEAHTESKWNAAELDKLGYGPDGDCDLVLAVLKFTRTLLQHCGNRSIYASSAHLSSLLNSSSLHILKATLHVGHELALRYHASYKRTSGTSRTFHTALLVNHYDINLDNVLQLALPFPKTPVAGSAAPSAPFASSSAATPQRAPATPGAHAAGSLSAGSHAAAAGSQAPAAPTTPATPATPANGSAGKGKEKANAEPTTPKAVTTMYTNDFVSMATGTAADWSAWGDVKVTYYPQHQSRSQEATEQDSTQGQTPSVHDRTGPMSSVPSTPTPLRRTSNMGTQSGTPRASGAAAAALDDLPSSPLTPAHAQTPAANIDTVSASASGKRTFEIPQSSMHACTVYELMARCPADMPAASRYELLNRIRIAKAMLGSVETRQLALAIRLLAITNLAFIHPELQFLPLVLKQDSEEPRRFQLIYQLAELIRPGAGQSSPVPTWLQLIAIQLLESMSSFTTKLYDVMSAVNSSVNHGILFYDLRKAVADMKADAPETPEEAVLNDEWRKQIFSLALHLAVGARVQDMISAGLMDILLDALKTRTLIAERNYLVVVTFLDTIMLNFPNSFNAFASAQGLDIAALLLVDTTDAAKKIADKGDVTPQSMRCNVVDYDIPFHMQQTLKWLLKFIYHLIASAYQYGAANDRLLRNLVDDTELLRAVRTILQNPKMYGSVVWTNAATLLSHFMNHDPTSFAPMSEAGIIQSLLETLTRRPLPSIDKPKKDEDTKPPETAAEGGHPADGDGSARGADAEAASASAFAPAPAPGSGSSSAPAPAPAADGAPPATSQSRNRDDDAYSTGDDDDDDDDDDEDDDDEEDSTVSDYSSSEDYDTRKVPISDEELERPRNWDIAGGIIPSPEAIIAIPSILNAICLNNNGRKMVMASGVLQSYFEIFESPAHIRCMETDNQLPVSIATTVDELARHHPSLRPILTTAVLDMTRRVCHMANTKSRTDGWGIKLLPGASSIAAAGEDVEMTDAAPVSGSSDPSAAAAALQASYNEALPYFSACALFLNIFLNNSNLMSFFIKRGGIDPVLDLADSAGLPFISNSSSFSTPLLQLLGRMLEHSPILGVPAICKRVSTALNDVQPYLDAQTLAATSDAEGKGKGKAPAGDEESSEKKEATVSIFAPFVQPDGPAPPAEDIAKGTAIIKAFAKARYMLILLRTCFPSKRHGTPHMYTPVAFDYFEDFIKKMGPLMVFAKNQVEILSNSVPANWTQPRAPTWDVLTTNSSSAPAPSPSFVLGSTADGQDPSVADVLSNVAFAQLSENGAAPSAGGDDGGDGAASALTTVIPAPAAELEKPTPEVTSSPAYQNYQALQALFRALPFEIMSAYQSIGKSILSKRERDNFLRSRQLRLADSIISTLLGQLRALDGSTIRSQKQRCELLKAILDLLVEQTATSSRGEATSAIFMSLFVAFKRQGGFDTFNALLRSFIKTVEAGSGDKKQATNEMYLAGVGVKNILELYAIVGNHKIVTEWASTLHNMLRSSDAQFSIQHQTNQLILEIWAAILPVISEVWQSSIIELFSAGILSKVIEIMKTIASSELDAGYFTRATRPKTMPADGFEAPNVPFPWTDYEPCIDALISRGGFTGELAQEAVYRANGSLDMAMEYCRHWKAETMRVRHPIPAEDLPTPSTPEADKKDSEVKTDASAPADSSSMATDTLGGDTATSQSPADITSSRRQPLRFDLGSSEDSLLHAIEAMTSQGPGELSPVLPAEEKNAKPDEEDAAAASNIVTKEDVEEQVEELRKDLVDRCLSVIQMHPDVVQDIAELISACVFKKSKSDNTSVIEEVGETIFEALVSFSFDTENMKLHAQEISACAYLFCLLLIKSETFYNGVIETLTANLDALMNFIRFPGEDLPSWLPHFYLLFEILLMKDEREPAVEWTLPTIDSESIETLVVKPKDVAIKDTERRLLLDCTLDILPRIGKDEVLAVAVSRVLEIMTRRHDEARIVGDKKALQRLFLMMKQLSGLGANGLSEIRLPTYIVTILRHIVEDEDVLRQIMRYEIRNFMESSSARSQRPVDLRSFLEANAHLAIRNPKIFVSVLSDLVKLTHWPDSVVEGISHSFAIILKETSSTVGSSGVSKKAPSDDSFGPAVQATQELNINDVRPTTETDADAAAATTPTAGDSSVANTGEAAGDDKDMPDAPAKSSAGAADNTHAEPHKRPIVENPDGVITFLLEQLMTYQKVDDVEPTATAKDGKDLKVPLGIDIPAPGSGAATPDPVSDGLPAPSTPPSGLDIGAPVFGDLADQVAAAAAAATASSSPTGSKDKDKDAQVFKTADHPIFVYRAFLMSCLSELLKSYSRSKMEFINYKRGVALQTFTPVKPRTSVLNYLLHDLLCGPANSPATSPDSILGKKKAAMSDHAKRLLSALVEKTPEKFSARTTNMYDYEEDSDIQFVRRFVLDTVLKAYKETANSTEVLDIRYGKMACLGELMSFIIGADRDRASSLYNESRSHMQLRRMMFEKGFLAAITHSIADVDLAFPGTKRTLKHVLRVLNALTETAIDLSRANIISSTTPPDPADADIMSTSSMSDIDDDREETPDLYRNSSLGMLEGADIDDEEYSDSDGEVSVYDDEEMEYDEEMTDDGEEPLSDDDDDEMGPGEHGEPGVVELVMEDGEDDEDEDEDEDSDEMEDIDQAIEEAIEELGDDEVMEDDGASEWESEPGEDDHHHHDHDHDHDHDHGGEDPDDYDDDNDDDDHHHHHHHHHFNGELGGHGGLMQQVQIRVPDGDHMSHFEEIVRNINNEYGEGDVGIDNFDDPYFEDGNEEEDEDEDEEIMDEDEYVYDQDYPHDHMDMPNDLTWESFLGRTRNRYYHQHHPNNGHPVVSSRRGFPDIFRADRPNRPGWTVDDDLNRLLQRPQNGSRDANNRPAFSSMLRLGVPEGIFTRPDNPMAFINELMNSLPPFTGRGGQPLHLQITQGPRGEIREVSLPMPPDGRNPFDIRGADPRRDTSGAPVEPSQAINFRTCSTPERWVQEGRMIFNTHMLELARSTIFQRVLYTLAPAALERAREERKQAEEEAAKYRERIDEERKKKEAKQAEEAARKKAEDEEKARVAAAEAAAAEAAAAEAAAAAAEAAATAATPGEDNTNAADSARGDRDTSEPMEGVETETDAAASGAPAVGDETSASGAASGDVNTSDETGAADAAEAAPSRVVATIRGQEFDITGLGIDPEYLEALPEEFREEVIAQTLSARRSEARQAETSGDQNVENFNAFLDALPDDLRDEIVQQEEQDLRRRQREEERRQASNNVPAVDATAQEVEDTVTMLRSIPAQLRDQILMEQGEELMNQLPPDLLLRARSLVSHRQRTPHTHRAPARDEAAQLNARGDIAEGSRAPAAAAAAAVSGVSRVPVDAASTESGAAAKVERRPVVQMMDRQGVATMLRLMFVMQQGSTRDCLFNLFIDLCQNRQSRLEVISTLLQILQDGSADMDAVERCFNQLSAKARQPPKLAGVDKDGKGTNATTTTPGTGNSLKRSLTSTSVLGGSSGTPGGGLVSSSQHTNLDSSPLLLVGQSLDLLIELCSRNSQIPILFLTDHDIVGASLRKPFGSRKAKGVHSRAARYGINLLLLLLEKDLVMESSSVMQQLAELLNRVTQPLQAMERRQREQARIEQRQAREAKRAETSQAHENENEHESANEHANENAHETEAGSSSAAAAAAAEGDNAAASTAAATTAADKDKAAAAVKAKTPHSVGPPHLEPFIPEHNISLVVNIFVARECSSKTFQNTITTIKNLCCIGESTKKQIGQELTRQAKTLSDKILGDLEELLPHIEKAETGDEIQRISMAKFSPGAAEQNKLLRVLTALDHLFGDQAKKAEKAEKEKLKEKLKKDKSKDDDRDEGEDYKGEDYMGDLYQNATFAKMWARLSLCLAAIRDRDNLLNVAMILLPLIESLMVVCKNTNLGDAEPTASASQPQPMSMSLTLSGGADKDKGKDKDKDKEATDGSSSADARLLLSSPPPEAAPASNLFFRFTEEHRRILNELVRSNPKLMSGTFSLLVKNPKVLEFDNKRNYFNRRVHSKTGTQAHRPSFPPLQLSVRRDQVFHDSFRSLYFKSGDEMKYGKLNIRFHGEEGVDAGGVTREWFQVLSRQMFDPNNALFIPVSSDRTTFHPNKSSWINEEHLLFFKFIGRIIGKALYEGRLLECYFSRAVYKRLLGKPVSVKDMESFDPEYYKSLVWMLENDITDVITETFSVINSAFGADQEMDLIENGRNVPVTEENKHEYVRLVVEFKLVKSVEEQMGEFLKGFHEIIPAELIQIFTEQELELLISGLPDIDIDDWRANTEYHNYSSGAPQIQWFWRAVRSFDKEERAKLLQFVTGTSKVPLNGFKELEGMNGVNRFNIHRDYGNKNRLPSSHTCFNQLDLPEYESYDVMRTQLLKAITTGNEYFGFA